MEQRYCLLIPDSNTLQGTAEKQLTNCLEKGQSTGSHSGGKPWKIIWKWECGARGGSYAAGEHIAVISPQIISLQHLIRKCRWPDSHWVVCDYSLITSYSKSGHGEMKCCNTTSEQTRTSLLFGWWSSLCANQIVFFCAIYRHRF